MILVALCLAASVAAARGSPAGPAAATHPLDALTAEEVARSIAILRGEGRLQSDATFPWIQLEEPDKSEVLAWTAPRPFSRKARVVVRQARRVFEAIVDLQSGRADRWRERQGVQTPLLGEEWSFIHPLLTADPRWQKAMRARGYTSFDAVFCESYTAGYYGTKVERGRRLARSACYDTSSGGNNLYARPIEGISSLIDLDRRIVLDVHDSGPVPVNRSADPALAPAEATTDDDPPPQDIQVSGSVVQWRAWSFHLRFDRRVGPILSLVRFNDGGRARSVLYSGTLSEIFVPYMDRDPAWGTRTFMDAGEYGLGRLASSLEPRVDCPKGARYLDAVLPTESGETSVLPRTFCLFERATGAPQWRHRETLNGTFVGRAETDLVVRAISTVGNYDYVFDWVFNDSGEIRFAIGATGYPAVKGIAEGTAAKSGTKVAPDLLAVSHDHFFSLRLDLDVDGISNTLIGTRVQPETIAGGLRSSLWVPRDKVVVREGKLPQRAGESWRVINPNLSNPLGQHPGYEIVPGPGSVSALDPGDPAQRRAGFSTASMWLTRYRASELYAAGDYPNQSHGGDGLPRFAKHDRTDDQDLVLWYSLGFHHLTRPEDWPIQSTVWHDVLLRPFGFFDQNPSLPSRPRSPDDGTR